MAKSDHKIGFVVLLMLVGTYLTVMFFLSDQLFIYQALLNWGSNVAIVALLIGPLVWMRNRGKLGENVPHTISIFGIAAFIFLVHMCVLLAPRYGWFESLDFNWQGKLISLAIGVSIVAIWSRLSWRSIGVVSPRKGTWRRFMMILAGMSFFWVLAGSQYQPANLDLETLLFQATIPGLEEELFYRGILWVLLAQALPGTKRLGRTDIGWSLIITTLLFALAHGVTFNNELALVFDPVILVYSGIIGFLIGWIRAYSGSIIPAILLHNGINLLSVIVPWIIYAV